MSVVLSWNEKKWNIDLETYLEIIYLDYTVFRDHIYKLLKIPEIYTQYISFYYKGSFRKIPTYKMKQFLITISRLSNNINSVISKDHSSYIMATPFIFINVSFSPVVNKNKFTRFVCRR